MEVLCFRGVQCSQSLLSDSTNPKYTHKNSPHHRGGPKIYLESYLESEATYENYYFYLEIITWKFTCVDKPEQKWHSNI